MRYSDLLFESKILIENHILFEYNSEDGGRRLAKILRLGMDPDDSRRYNLFVRELPETNPKLYNDIIEKQKTIIDQIESLVPDSIPERERGFILEFLTNNNRTNREINELQYYATDEKYRETFRQLMTKLYNTSEVLETLPANTPGLAKLDASLPQRLSSLKQFINYSKNAINLNTRRNTGVNLDQETLRRAENQNVRILINNPYEKIYLIRPLTPEFSIEWARSGGRNFETLCTAMTGNRNQLNTYLQGGSNEHGEPINAGPVYYLQIGNNYYFINFANVEFTEIGKEPLYGKKLSEILNWLQSAVPQVYETGMKQITSNPRLRNRLKVIMNPKFGLQELLGYYNRTGKKITPTNTIRRVLLADPGTHDEFQKFLTGAEASKKDDYYGKLLQQTPPEETSYQRPNRSPESRANWMNAIRGKLGQRRIDKARASGRQIFEDLWL